MGWDEVKDEKEGYVRVRKSNLRGLAGRLKKENDSAEATGYIELNKEDLGGLGGGGNAPHSHSEYSGKSHGHDDKADKDHTHDITHTHDGFATTAHTHPPQDTTHDHTGEYQPLGDYATNDALSGKSDTTHTHDTTHNHDGTYQPVGNYADADHTHDGSVEGARFDPTYLEEKDAEEDARIESLEESQEEQNARLDALEESMGGDGDCILGRYIRNDFFYHNGGAQAQDYYLKLHKPTEKYGDDGNQGDLDNRDIDKNMSAIEEGDTIWLIVGDNVHEITLAAKQDMSYYYGYRFDERVESLVPKDAEFLLQSAETCEGGDESDDHEHEGMVVSDSVTSIVRLTEAEYEGLTDKDPSTLYLVV